MTYLDNCDKYDCNGCGICALKCPKNAITMIKDFEGFLYPKIDKKKCINCGICSNNPKNNYNNSKTYAIKNKNVDERMKSTSGGIFRIIAKRIIELGGVVFGAGYDKELNVIHIMIDNYKQLYKISSSKYVRSDLKDSFTIIREKLENNIYVLFSGTPCQCYALKCFLNKEYKKLFTCEIICHSNPSPLIYDLYKKNIEKKYRKKIKEVHFRSKDKELFNIPFIEFNDNTKISENSYNMAFGNMLISRPSCSKCRFSNMNRKSDFTIGDFWGIKNINKFFDDGKGVSLLCLNSNKAIKLFDTISYQTDFIRTDKETGFRYNHHKNIAENKKRGKFFQKVKDKKINEKNIIIYLRKYSKQSLVKRAMYKIGVVHK